MKKANPAAAAPTPPNRVRRYAWQFIKCLIFAYLIVVIIEMFLETSMVYPIPPVARGDWKPAGLDFEDVHFTSADGAKLHGWFVPHANPKRAILYCHGNGEQVGDNAELVAELRDGLQASVMIFDYRGYGHSEGTPNETGCIADARAARDWLATKTGIPPNQLVLIGRSLGGGVAVALAAESGAGALVVENTFSTLVDVAALHLPWLPVRWLMRNRYNSLERIKNYNGPLFQIHGADDELIPVTYGRRMFDAAPTSQKQFIAIPGLGHNDMWPASYYAKLAAFLDDLDREPNAASNAAK